MNATHTTLPRNGFTNGFVWATLASPIVIVFLSSNFVNAGNLLFNMLFSRWMGPALFGDLSLVLTIKLALLGMLGAVQIAVSRHVAHHGMRDNFKLSKLSLVFFMTLWCLVPLVILLIEVGGPDWLGMQQPSILLIVLLSLPFAAPLSILRGIAHGRMDVSGIVISANVEMIVRLIGSIIFWHFGFGAQGVAIAIGLSIVAGWIVIVGRYPSMASDPSSNAPFIGLICKAALPFAILQAAQVFLLDGDIFAVKILLDEVAAGYVAALALFQRISFFACFGLAAVLLPKVVEASVRNTSTIRAAAPVMAIFAIVTIGITACALIAPRTVITLIVGPDYLEVADLLILSAFSASAFTFSYLLATYLSALNNNRGIWVIAAFVPLQIGAFFVAEKFIGSAGLNNLMITKALCQTVLLASLLWLFYLDLKDRPKTISSQ